MDSEALAALLGALIGGAMTIAGNLAHDRLRERRRAKQISRAVAGEISAVMEIVRSRGYIRGIRQAEADARAGNAWVMKIRITKNYFPVVEASLMEIGILPAELPTLIPRFLTMAKAAIEDIHALAEGHWDDRDPASMTEGYQELGGILEAALDIGTRIAAVVERTYPTK
jgi:hypothetical protein